MGRARFSLQFYYSQGSFDDTKLKIEICGANFSELSIQIDEKCVTLVGWILYDYDARIAYTPDRSCCVMNKFLSIRQQ